MAYTSLAAPTIGAEMDKTNRHHAWKAHKARVLGCHSLPITRDEAKAHGMMFFDGKVCSICKNTTRYVSTSQCRTCKVNTNAVQTAKQRGTYAPKAVKLRRSIEDLKLDLELKSFDRVG